MPTETVVNLPMILLALAGIVVSVFWGTKFKTNSGIPAIIFAVLIGIFGLGMTAKSI